MNVFRRILTTGMGLGLLKQVNVYSLADLFWAITVGVIQLEDMKGDDQRGNKFKKNVLDLAESFFNEALVNHRPDSHEKI